MSFMKQDSNHRYTVLAYYLFAKIADPSEEIRQHKEFLSQRDATGRIYISEEGINGQLSGLKHHAEEYISWMQEHPVFRDIVFKCDSWHENCFPRMTIKYRNQLVALDCQVDVQQTARHISPKEWRDRLDEKEEKLLLDVRNDYEWDVGHFEGSERPQCKTFREFVAFTDRLVEEGTPLDKPVMMCCTGGIRCELYSVVMKEKGFTNVVQLDGGIINYGQQEGNRHWKGKLFVFDDRLAVPISDEENEVVGECHFCHSRIDAIYNCANMDCNELFLCCPECLSEYKGCCSSRCGEAPRVRPLSHQQRHKPFRRQHHYRTK